MERREMLAVLGAASAAQVLAGVTPIVAEAMTTGVGAGEDAGAHGPALTQVAGEGPGVDALDPDDALGRKVVLQGAPRAPAGRAR